MTPTDQPEEVAILAAVRAGDQAAFAALAERYRRQLHVHCYRMLGSVEDAEDVVQETLLRAWRSRASFQGRSLFRTWLYRIATNACLNALQRAPRRILVADVPPRDPSAELPADERPDLAAPPAELPWLQPYPDHLLDQAAPSDAEPDAVVVARETIELAYLAAIQYLPPRQRAILILRDALGWSAKDTAGLLETSVASVNSALQRARSTMRARLPARRVDWAQATGPSDDERSVLRRFMDAHDRADVAAFAALLREDARQAMPPHLLWYDGREAMVTCSRATSILPRRTIRASCDCGRGRQPAAGGGCLPPAGGRRPLPAPRARCAGGRERAGQRDHLLRRPAAGGVRPSPDAPGRPMSFRAVGVQAEAGRCHPNEEVK